MKNEAELAGVLSHEIVHVVQRHGIRELETVKTRTASEKLMDSLDEELSRRGMDTGDKELMQELESLADDMFDLLTGGRKRESEDESDRYGTLVLYNTGYTPEGLKSFLSTIEKIDDEKKNTVYSHRFYNERESIINSVIEDNKLSGRDRVKLEERFEKNVE
jgi:predicted Zn-dependent protease